MCFTCGFVQSDPESRNMSAAELKLLQKHPRELLKRNTLSKPFETVNKNDEEDITALHGNIDCLLLTELNKHDISTQRRDSRRV